MADRLIRPLEYPKVFAVGRGTPSWTRLEPESVTGDPRPGLEARIHDPLWLLCRQWQLGELEGDDAGSPLGVQLSTTSRPLSRWQAGAWDGPPPHRPALPLAAETLLEPVVEDEPATALGLRERAEAGDHFLAALRDAGLAALTDAVLEHAAVQDAPSSDPHDRSWAGLMLLLAGRAVDGRRLATALDSAAAEPSGLPAWLRPADPADRAKVSEIVRGWLGWYRLLQPAPDPATDAWVGNRLEYRFSVAGRTGAGEAVLRASEFVGGEIDWFSFDLDPAADPFGTPDDPGRMTVQTRYATPLRFAGMPADRLWEFEDATVNLGALQVEPHDLARLLLVEYAVSYGNDWLVVPVDVPTGSLTTIDWLTYTTTFGERFLVRRPRARRGNDRWRMFTVASADGGDELEALLVPPAVVALDEGGPREEVLFVRDENANLAWAVEQTVTAPSGDTRARVDEGTAPAPVEPGDTDADLDYRLQLGVPEHWIPYLPRTSGYRSIELAQGRMRRADGTLVPPVGVLLNEPAAGLLADAEVPREGVLVRRVPVLARRADGSYERWTARRVTLGRGEGTSGLAFDAAIQRKG
jgi:hypothetical protein